MTREEFVKGQLAYAKGGWQSYFSALPDETRLRLSAMEAEILQARDDLTRGLWELYNNSLQDLAEDVGRECPCCHQRRKKNKGNRPIRVTVMSMVVYFFATYYHCRGCKQGEAPVRTWLGISDGYLSLGFERVLTDLTTRMTYGDAVNSLKEQQGQEIDRTKAERVTYRVGKDAEVYLKQRRDEAKANIGKESKTEGEGYLELTADGGIVPVGTLKRPPIEDITPTTVLTPVRGLAKGTREIAGREARLISSHTAGDVTQRVVDLHIAPYNQPEVSGDRMLAIAALAGLGDNTHIHGVFDMGKWIGPQFTEQFHAYVRTAVADIMHVAEYLTNAGRVIVGKEAAFVWGQTQKRRLLDGDIDGVITELCAHTCNGHCEKDEKGTCFVKVATRFIKNNRSYLDYPPVLKLELAIGSGEAESGVRHIIKKRTDVAGAWKEENLKYMLALLAIRASGWWDNFWKWRDQNDMCIWKKRQSGEIKTVFRGKPRTVSTHTN